MWYTLIVKLKLIYNQGIYQMRKQLVTILCAISILLLHPNSSETAEHRINANPTAGLSAGLITSNGSNYMVTWTDNGDGIYGRLLNPDFSFISSDIVIAYDGANYKGHPSIASNGSNYLVAWTDWDSTNGYYTGLRTVSATGTLGTKRMNSNQLMYGPGIAGNNGSYMIAWESWENYAQNGYYVRGQMLSGTGTQTTNSFKIDTYQGNRTTSQLYPEIASNGSDFLTVWQDYNSSSGYYDVYARMVTSSGNTPNAPVQILTTSNGSGYKKPEVTSNGSNYLVTWVEQDNTLRAQFFSNSGSLVSNSFDINTTQSVTGNHHAASNGTDFLAAYASNGNVFGRLIDGSGNFISDEFQVNAYTTNTQRNAYVASNGQGYMITWLSNHEISTQNDIYANTLTADNHTRWGYLTYAHSKLNVDWNMDELNSLYDLHASANTNNSLNIDNEIWEYANFQDTYNNNGFWGEGFAVGESQMDKYGFKHVNLEDGTGITTFDKSTEWAYLARVGYTLFFGELFNQDWTYEEVEELYQYWFSCSSGLTTDEYMEIDGIKWYFSQETFGTHNLGDYWIDGTGNYYINMGGVLTTYVESIPEPLTIISLIISTVGIIFKKSVK